MSPYWESHRNSEGTDRVEREPPVEAWKQAALLLVGHGSSRLSTSREATDRLAEAIRRQDLFAEVASCFWKEPPFLSLDLVSAKTVYIVPNFAGEGLFTQHLIPDKLGLTGAVTDTAGRRLIYTAPLGSHPRLPDLLLRRVEDLCRREEIAETSCGLLIIGHGSRRSGGVSRTPEAVAAYLRKKNRFAQVETAYLEQAPFVGDWPQRIKTEVVIAAPWLVSEGMHATEDLPPHFGLAVPIGGPVSIAGRRAWLLGGIGRDQEVVELILDSIFYSETGHRSRIKT
jgi:sirohydrochlorin cobaltochelatase